MGTIKEKLQTGMIAVDNAGTHYMIYKDLIENKLYIISNDKTGPGDLAFYDNNLIYDDKNNPGTINMVYIPDLNTVGGLEDFLNAPIKEIIFERVNEKMIIKSLDKLKKEYNKISIDFKQNSKKTAVERRQFIENLDNFDLLLDKFSDKLEKYLE